VADSQSYVRQIHSHVSATYTLRIMPRPCHRRVARGLSLTLPVIDNVGMGASMIWHALRHMWCVHQWYGMFDDPWVMSLMHQSSHGMCHTHELCHAHIIACLINPSVMSRPLVVSSTHQLCHQGAWHMSHVTLLACLINPWVMSRPLVASHQGAFMSAFTKFSITQCVNESFCKRVMRLMSVTWHIKEVTHECHMTHQRGDIT